MSDWLTDVRHVVRGCRRTPGVSLTIVATLALGLGLASAVFAFADGYLFRPLPFPGASQTYYVGDPNGAIAGMLRAYDTQELRRSSVASLGFVEFDTSNRVQSAALVIGDREVPFYVHDLSPGFSRTVALPLLVGRDFTDDDYRDGNPVPVWLNHRFWLQEFGGDRAVLGRTLRLAGGKAQAVIVIGILAPTVSAFELNNRPPDAFAAGLPQAIAPPNARRLSYPLVRLPDGMTREQGTTVISNALQAVAPAADGTPRVVRLRSLTENQVAGGRPTARVLFAGAMLVLLLAAINLVHLLLARGVARAAEIATRAALGASRWRVTRLFLIESLLLGATGIGAGLVLGGWLAQLIEARIPRFPTSGRNMALVPMLFDWRVVAFAVVLGLTVSFIGGIWPARRALRRSFASNTRAASGLSAAIPTRLSRSILASELAVATVVMIGTVFVGSGIWRYLHQPLGFDYADRAHVTLTLPDGRQASPAQVDAVRQAVAGAPGVIAAGPGTGSLGNVRGDIEVPGRALDPRQFAGAAATAGYFETWNLRLRAGRWFEPREFAGQEPVAVVDQKVVRAAWPDAEPVGQEIRVAGVSRRVVGVIESVRGSLKGESPGRVYVPVALPDRWTSLVAWAPGVDTADLEARVSPVVAALLPGAKARLRPVTLENLYLREIGEAQFQAPIVFAFGVLAFVLAGIGVFGLVSYLVEQRTREFGIRLALGARRSNIWRNVIRQSVVPAIVGLTIGVGGAWALESVVRASVFGWQSSGAGAVAVVAAALVLVAILAAMLPAHRAMRIDPAVTLRSE